MRTAIFLGLLSIAVMLEKGAGDQEEWIIPSLIIIAVLFIMDFFEWVKNLLR